MNTGPSGDNRRSPRRFPTSRHSVKREIDDELRFHIESRVEELIAGGMPERNAREAALREYGDVDASRHELQRVDRGRIARWRVTTAWDAFWHDVRHAARALRRQPAFSAIVVVTLALAIGANAAMFGIIDRLVLRGPEYLREPERLVRAYVRMTPPGAPSRMQSVVSFANLTDLRGAQSFERVGAYSFGSLVTGEGAGARLLQVTHATSDFFPMLGVRPYLGRFFTPEEDQPADPQNVAVLDYALWQQAFAGDGDVLGKTIEMDRVRYTVIGVAPRGFTGAELQPTDVWLPMSLERRNMQMSVAEFTTTRRSNWLAIVGRLRPGTTASRAGAEATAIHRRNNAGTKSILAGGEVVMLPISRDNRGNPLPEAAVARWLIGVTAIVLLIACANVGNLLLVRLTRRRREMAVRLALGVSGGRIVRLMSLEAILLVVAGTAAGLFVAYRGGGAIRTVLLPNIVWGSVVADTRVVLFALLAAAVTALLIGVVPALHFRRSDITAALKTGTREGGGRGGRLRMGLLVMQPALAVILLIGAGLFIASLQRVRSLNLGIETDRVLTVDVFWPTFSDTGRAARAAESARRRAFREETLERFHRTGWIESATLALGTPFQASFGVDLRVPGLDSIPPTPGGGPFITVVGSEYFATVGTRLRRGRVFTEQDGKGSERVVIVNEEMARVLWPNVSALDRCLVVFADTMPCARVVGIVENARRFRIREDPAMQFYVPLGQEVGLFGSQILLRPKDPDARNAIPLIRREMLRIRPDLPYARIRPLQEVVDPQVRPWRLGAFMFTLFGALALAVAAIGLYSVLAYLVEQRRYEFGVRTALGARKADILRNTLRRGFVPALTGLALGAAVSLAAGPLIEPLLFNTSAREPLVFGAVALVLCAIAVLASVLPAWRAARVDPLIAMRAE